VWKSKVKRLQEQYECSKRQVEGAQFELERVKERNRKLEAMGRKKNLDERELLAARLEEMTAKVQDRDKQIVELEYASQLQAKALQRDLKQLQSKNRSLYLKVDQLDQDCQRLRRQLRVRAGQQGVLLVGVDVIVVRVVMAVMAAMAAMLWLCK
jgi:chromosome segregation ATPase